MIQKEHIIDLLTYDVEFADTLYLLVDQDILL